MIVVVSPHGSLPHMRLTRCLVDLTRTVNAALLATRMADSWTANSTQCLALSATLRSTQRRLGLVPQVWIHIVNLFGHYTLIMARQHSTLCRTKLIVSILCSIVWLEYIWSTWSLVLWTGFLNTWVRLTIHHDWWILLENLLKVNPVSCDPLLLLHFSIV